MDSMWRTFIIAFAVVMVIKLFLIAVVFGCPPTEEPGYDPNNTEFWCELVRGGTWYSDNGVGHCIES